MWLGVNVLLWHLDVWDLLCCHHQVEIHTLEQEDSGVFQAAGDWGLTDQCPLTGPPVVVAVLQSGSWFQVTLQEGLDNTVSCYDHIEGLAMPTKINVKGLNRGKKVSTITFSTSDGVCALITATDRILKMLSWILIHHLTFSIGLKLHHEWV